MDRSDFRKARLLLLNYSVFYIELSLSFFLHPDIPTSELTIVDDESCPCSATGPETDSQRARSLYGYDSD